MLARVQAGAGLRLFDPYIAGVLAPPFVHVQGAFLFVNAGPLRMGPSLGGQLGFDLGHSGMQGTIQPGWAAMARFSRRMGLVARVDLPILLTRNWVPDGDLCLFVTGMAGQPNRTAAMQSPCVANNMVPARVPYGKGLGVALGVEAAAAFQFYLTAGLALTAEINGGAYFGDSGVTTPLLGFALGASFDYELLP